VVCFGRATNSLALGPQRSTAQSPALRTASERPPSGSSGRSGRLVQREALRPARAYRDRRRKYRERPARALPREAERRLTSYLFRFFRRWGARIDQGVRRLESQQVKRCRVCRVWYDFCRSPKRRKPSIYAWKAILDNPLSPRWQTSPSKNATPDWRTKKRKILSDQKTTPPW
jgi:hypothetical protein